MNRASGQSHNIRSKWCWSVAPTAACLALGGALSPAQLAARVKFAGFQVLTRIVVSEPGPGGQLMTGYLEPTVHPLLYGYSLPLFFGLCLATPQEEGRRWGQLMLGCLAIWLAQAFGIAADALKVLALSAGPEAAAAVQEVGLNVDVIALCYQFGYLILPTVVPAALWLALNRPFIEALTGRKFGEPGGGSAGRNRAS